MRFNPKDYQEVKDRLPLFFEKYPEGRVIPSLEVRDTSGEKERVVFKCEIYRNFEDDKPLAAGWAEEHEGGGGANRDCWLENCETSAIGRALANIGLHGSKRPSREEMAKVQRHELGGELTENMQAEKDAKRLKDGRAYVSGVFAELSEAEMETLCQDAKLWPSATVDEMTLGQCETIAKLMMEVKK